MTVHLAPGAAERCISACNTFISEIQDTREARVESGFACAVGEFATSRQLGEVYQALVGTDLKTLIKTFVDQATAMSRLFAVAGGIIDAQDEAVATALGKAAGPVPELQSLSLGSLTPLNALSEPAVGGYSTVGPEDVSDAEFEQIKAGAREVATRMFATSGTDPRPRASYRS